MVREENTSEIIGLILLIIILTFVFLYVALYGKTIDNEIDSAIFEVRLNDDGTAEAKYVFDNWVNTPIGSYTVYFEANPNCNQIGGYTTYYYRVTGVEKND